METMVDCAMIGIIYHDLLPNSPPSLPSKFSFATGAAGGITIPGWRSARLAWRAAFLPLWAA